MITWRILAIFRSSLSRSTSRTGVSRSRMGRPIPSACVVMRKLLPPYRSPSPLADSRIACKGEEPRRIVPEDPIPIVRIGQPSRQAGEQVAVLDPLRGIEERPVRAPDAAVQTEGVDGCRNERLEIRVWEWLIGGAEGRRQLHHGIHLPAQGEYGLEPRLIHAARWIGFAGDGSNRGARLWATRFHYRDGSGR